MDQPSSTDADVTADATASAADAPATDVPEVISDPPPRVIDNEPAHAPIVIEQADPPELLKLMARQPRGWYEDPHDVNRQRFWSGTEFLSSRPVPRATALEPAAETSPAAPSATWKVDPPSQIRSLLALLGLVVGGGLIVVAVYMTASWTTAAGLVGGIIAAISCVMLGYTVRQSGDKGATPKQGNPKQRTKSKK